MVPRKPLPHHLVVANLVHQEQQQPLLHFERVAISNARQKCDRDSTIEFYRLQDGRIEADLTSPTYISHRKAMTKAHTASMILTQLVVGNTATSGGPKRKHDPSASVGDTVVIADEAFIECGTADTHSWNMFLSTEFTFPIVGPSGIEHRLASTQYLQVSSPTLKVDDKLLQQRSSPAFSNVEIVTGVCIFNNHLLDMSLGVGGSGNVDSNCLSDVPATIHELDYIARCSSAVADMAAMFAAQGKQSLTPAVNIRLDIPSFHYYPSALQNYDKGHASAAETLQWMNAVDRRHDQISYIFTNAIEHELRKRGVDPTSLDIHTSAKSNSFATAMRHSVHLGKRQPLQDMLEELHADKNQLWHDFYKLIPEKERPQDLEGLAYLFYVFAAVKPALVKDTRRAQTALNDKTTDGTTKWTSSKRHQRSQSDAGPSRLILSVDDPVERRIYSRAQEVLRKLRTARKDLPKSVLVETYICRRVFVNGNKTRARLYRTETTPQPILLSIAQHGEGENFKTNQTVRPLDVVRELYGYELACNLENWAIDMDLPLH